MVDSAVTLLGDAGEILHQHYAWNCLGSLYAIMDDLPTPRRIQHQLDDRVTPATVVAGSAGRLSVCSFLRNPQIPPPDPDSSCGTSALDRGGMGNDLGLTAA